MTLEEWQVANEILKDADWQECRIEKAVKKVSKRWGARPTWLRYLAYEVLKQRKLMQRALKQRMRDHWPVAILDVDSKGALVEKWRGRDNVVRSDRTEALLA